MSTPLPEWMKSLTEQLGLDDTPAAEGVDDAVTNLVDVVKHIEFTPKGWAYIKRLIVGDRSVDSVEFFRRVTEASDDDMMMFTALIAIPYGLARILRYSEKHSEQLINYFAASYVIAMARGYELGVEDSLDERRTRDE